MTVVECPCGCGETFASVGSRGRTRTYFSPGCSLRVNRVNELSIQIDHLDANNEDYPDDSAPS